MGRGQWGEGSIGATIKDTRTKSRRVEVGEGCGTGWGGVEGRGENAENILNMQGPRKDCIYKPF